MKTSSKLRSQIHSALNVIATIPRIDTKRGLTVNKVLYNSGIKNMNAITSLRKILFNEKLLVEYSDYIVWNKAYCLPNDALCDRIYVKVSDTLYKSRVVEVKSTKLDKISLKDFKDLELVSELRKRGFEVKCEKILCL